MKTDGKAAPGAPKAGKTRLIVLCALAVMVAVSASAMYRLSQESKKTRDWKPGEVVVGSERVRQMISGLPTQAGADLNAADLSALWLAAFETVQSGACAQVTGGGVQASSNADAQGIYFIICGPDAPQRWYRQDAHGVELCADANACSAR